MNSSISTQKEMRLALALMISGGLLLPVLDVFAKLLSATMPVGEVTAGRFFFQVIFMGSIALVMRQSLWPEKPFIQIARGVLLAIATTCFFAALQKMAIADAIAIFFVEPLILTLLSKFFLGENVGWRRLSAVLTGFAGALLIIQPSFQQAGFYAIFPLLTATCFAVYLMLSRLLVQTTDAVVMQFHAGLFGLLFILAIIALGSPFDLPGLGMKIPEPIEWLYLFAMGVFGTLGHFLIVQATRWAPASTLAPFQYLEIVSASLLGYLVFGNFPNLLSWLGIVIIVASGSYVAYREQKTDTS